MHFFVIFDVFKTFSKILYNHVEFRKKHDGAVGKLVGATVLELHPNFELKSSLENRVTLILTVVP